MQYDTGLPDAQLERILDSIEPDWTLRDATHVEGGVHIVYRLTAETGDGTETVYLKATPPEKPPTVHLDARLHAGIDANSDVPVPSVLGVVDEHADLPAPYAVLSTMPGTTRLRPELPSVSDEELRRIARQSGRYLAALHELDAVDAYGFLTHDGPPLAGDRPASDFSTIAVTDPTDDWRDCLGTWAEGTLNRLRDTQFADVVSRAGPAVESGIEQLDGPFEPVLARIDHSVENVLVEDGDVRAFIDWEFTLAATPAYDLQCVVWSLAGGPYRFSPAATERRPLVREAVLDGYRERAGADRIEQFHANRECYELLSTLRSMVHLEDWFELFGLGDRTDDAAEQLRSELDGRL